MIFNDSMIFKHSMLPAIMATSLAAMLRLGYDS